jgi:hypothetical protein
MTQWESDALRIGWEIVGHPHCGHWGLYWGGVLVKAFRTHAQARVYLRKYMLKGVLEC